MPDNTIRLDNVPGQHIIFRNFRGRPSQFVKEGDRSFCLIIFSSLLRDQLIARGCNIKKLTDGTEFVNVAVRIKSTENVDDIWNVLDREHIDKAWLEFTFHEYNVNGKKGCRVYLKNARFNITGFFEQCTIDVRWPDMVTVINSTNETNNTEETTMEKIMSVEEIIAQFALLEYAYNNANSTDKKNLEVIMKAVRAAKHYLLDTIAAVTNAKEEMKSKKESDTKSTHEAIGDFAAIKQVIFNDPATVVVWWDDTKTVVKCQKGDTFDKEKGLAMAICKRLYGNESNFNNVIKKWTEPKAKKVKEPVKKDSKPTEAKAYKARKLRADELMITDSWREYVRKRLAQNGWAQKDLSRRSGVSVNTISKLVGKYGPSPLKVVVFDKINKTLNIRWKVEEDAVPSSKKKEKSSNLVPLTDELINSVREKMKKRNISLSDLSRMSGVSLSAIGRYFSGNSPRPKAMHKRKYDAIMKVIDSSES